MPGLTAGLRGGPALLLLVLAAVLSGASQAQLVRPAASNSSSTSSSKCHSLTQCFLVTLGPPQTPGEWLTAYISALHEHCTGILQQGGPQDCQDSVRCMYIPPPDSTHGRGGSTSNLREANFLFAHNTSSNSMTGEEAAYWRPLAASLKINEEACLPIPDKVQTLKSRACVRQSAADASSTSHPQQYLQHCKDSPPTCFMRNSSSAADVTAWWTGQAPQAALESSSSWKRDGRLQRAADTCSASWAAQDRYVSDTCATRGVGKTPWNNSLTLSRLVVALMDAYESSACNNTVTYSEALAVERIVKDLCAGVECRVSSAAGVRYSRTSLMLLLAAVAAGAGAVVL